MPELLLVPVAVIYLIVVGLLFVYGINFFYMTFIAWKSHKKWMQRGRAAASSGKDEAPTAGVAPAGVPSSDAPVVTVQLPIYNELYVAERLIDAAAGLDYPKDRLEIQVLDDSNDETGEIVRSAVERLRLLGVNIRQITRSDRLGFKAGALAVGLAQARGEYLAIFDADFLPSPDFLKRTLPEFQDPRVGFVQARWGHTNRDFSLLTLLQSLAIDAHFMIEQFARSEGGYWFNFNGTAGVWRREALEDAGGWQADTLTEDLDLSYRSFLRGWRGAYLRDVEAPAEIPVSINAYRRQQHRWARGSLECAIKYLPQVWQAPVPVSRKIEASLHLTGYGVHLLLFALAVLYPMVLLLSVQYTSLISLFGIAFLFNATALAPTIFFAAAQMQLEGNWLKRLPVFLLMSAFGAGMMLNTLRAAVQAFKSREGVFERTPKYGIHRPKQDWIRQRYQLRMDPITYAELAFAAVNAATVLLAIQLHNWAIAVYAGLFAGGLLFVSGLTIYQTIAVQRYRSGRDQGD